MGRNWYQRQLNQIATYWAYSGLSPFGTQLWTAPTQISCRWEDREDRFIDSGGEEIVSRAVVYVDEDLSSGGYLALGTHAGPDPRSIDKAFAIRRFRIVPDVKNRMEEKKAIL